MLLRIVFWSLADSPATPAELRAALRDEPAAEPGLLLRAWVSHEASDRFGAVELWESRDAADRPLPAPVRELLGVEPTIGEELDVEATSSLAAELQRRGLAFE
ncbi:MAG TPA: hypothetical protein VFA82_01975 [Gaiellaceae bacterium]|nr:hypothetical protein [Gaiellaceae bacterium]